MHSRRAAELLPRGTLENGDFKRRFSKRRGAKIYHIERKEVAFTCSMEEQARVRDALAAARNSVYIFTTRQIHRQGTTDRSTTGRLDRRTAKSTSSTGVLWKENRL